MTRVTQLGADRGFVRSEGDFYPTDAALTRALLRVESFHGTVWEPACGDGAISQLVPNPVISTDLHDRGWGEDGVDFLTQRELRAPTIITNPPFVHWQSFAEQALSLRATHVALLGRLLLLEGRKRAEFFKQSALTRVWIVGRAKMLPPGAVDKGHSGTIAFAWFVWDRRGTSRPPTSIGWAFADRAASSRQAKAPRCGDANNPIADPSP